MSGFNNPGYSPLAALSADTGSTLVGHSNGKTVEENLAELYGSVGSLFTLKPIGVVGALLRQNGKKIVITGDSISYNHQSVDVVSRSSGDLCHPGQRSWSFMLGDIVHQQDNYFKFMDELEIERYGDSSLELYNAASSPQIFPFGGRLLTFKSLPSESPSFAFKYKHQGGDNKAYLLMIGSPTDFSCSFSVSVDGVTTYASLTNKLSTALYQGRDLRHIELPVPNDGKEHIIRVFNFSQNADTPDGSGFCALDVVGMSSKYTRVDLNGVGGFNAGDLLTQWNSRVLSKNPDVLVVLIGANDSYDGVAISDFKNNLISMVSQTRAVNSECEIIFMSSPGSTEGYPYSVDDAVTLQYVDAMREVANLQRTHFVDLFSLFNSTKPDNFRFDWVHLNRNGNACLAGVMCELMGLTYKNQDIDPNFSLISGAEFNTRKISGATLVASPAGTGTNPKTYGIAKKQGQDRVVKSCVSTDGETVRVTFLYPVDMLGGLSVEPWGFNSTLMTPVISGYGTDYVEFKIVKAGGVGLVAHSDYPTTSNDLSFIINYNGK